MFAANERELIWELARREFSERYAGATFGLIWAVIHPLMMMAIYLVVFGLVFKARISSSNDSIGSYSLYFLSGFASWYAFSETLSKGPSIIQQHAALVKQIVFPVELLPIKSVLAVSITQIVFLFLIFIYSALSNINPIMFLLPILIFCQFFLMCGIAFFLSSIGPFFRDTREFVQIFLTGGLFLTPVIYTPGSLHGILKLIVYLNPLSYPILVFQDVLFFGRFEHPYAWLLFGSLAVTIYPTGKWLFRKLIPLYGDVI